VACKLPQVEPWVVAANLDELRDYEHQDTAGCKAAEEFLEEADPT